MIQTYHPCDPNTKQKFKITQSVTINDFYQRLFCYPSCKSVIVPLKRCVRVLTGCFKQKIEKNKIKKPVSMNDVPTSSDSSDSDHDDDEYWDLPISTRNLGQVSVLYLQTMKSLAILFLILTLINLPMYYLYYFNTENLNSDDIQELFYYFSMGNMGFFDLLCGSTYLLHSEANEVYKNWYGSGSFAELEEPDSFIFPDKLASRDDANPLSPQEIKLQCNSDHDDKGNQKFIWKLDRMGFLQMTHQLTQRFSTSEFVCSRALNPTALVNETHDEENFVYRAAFRAYLQDHSTVQAKTKYNIDNQCSLNTMFRSSTEQQVFLDFFNEYCYLKSECSFTLHDPLPGQTQSIVQMMSGDCLERIFN